MKTLTFQQLGRYGRLGNQMFQIASTIGIAVKNGWSYAFPYWQNHDHKERFNTSEDIDIQKYFVNPLPVYTGPKLTDNFVHWGYWPITLRSGSGNMSLHGHLQSEKYFAHCADRIRWYFQMKNELPCNDFCAVHVRLGDYDDNYHPRLRMDYYEAAMKKFYGTGTMFLIFSDEPDKAWEMFSNHFGPRLDIFIHKNGSSIDDLNAMKSCKHFIIGNSTYSWWPAWLSNQPGKRVIAPKNWFGPVAKLSSDDIYAKGWEVI